MIIAPPIWSCIPHFSFSQTPCLILAPVTPNSRLRPSCRTFGSIPCDVPTHDGSSRNIWKYTTAHGSFPTVHYKGIYGEFLTTSWIPWMFCSAGLENQWHTIFFFSLFLKHIPLVLLDMLGRDFHILPYIHEFIRIGYQPPGVFPWGVETPWCSHHQGVKCINHRGVVFDIGKSYCWLPLQEQSFIIIKNNCGLLKLPNNLISCSNMSKNKSTPRGWIITVWICIPVNWLRIRITPHIFYNTWNSFYACLLGPGEVLGLKNEGQKFRGTVPLKLPCYKIILPLFLRQKHIFSL